MTVNAQSSGTGGLEPRTVDFHDNNHYATIVWHKEGRIRPASGSINVAVSGGDFSFSTNDATGDIGQLKFGQIEVNKVVG